MRAGGNMLACCKYKLQLAACPQRAVHGCAPVCTAAASCRQQASGLPAGRPGHRVPATPPLCQSPLTRRPALCLLRFPRAQKCMARMRLFVEGVDLAALQEQRAQDWQAVRDGERGQGVGGGSLAGRNRAASPASGPTRRSLGGSWGAAMGRAPTERLAVPAGPSRCDVCAVGMAASTCRPTPRPRPLAGFPEQQRLRAEEEQRAQRAHAEWKQQAAEAAAAEEAEAQEVEAQLGAKTAEQQEGWAKQPEAAAPVAQESVAAAAAPAPAPVAPEAAATAAAEAPAEAVSSGEWDAAAAAGEAEAKAGGKGRKAAKPAEGGKKGRRGRPKKTE